MNKENLILEYQLLKEEIRQKIEIYNSLVSFTITTSVAVLTYALSANKTILYLLPFGIIIPMSMRIAYYKLSIAKLSAYIIVFIEKKTVGLKYETRNKLINTKKERGLLRFIIFKDCECLILSITTYLLYVLSYIKNKSVSLDFHLLWPLSFVVYEYIVMRKIRLIDKDKDKWVKKWAIVEHEEN